MKQCLCRFLLEVPDIFRRQDTAVECMDHSMTAPLSSTEHYCMYLQSSAEKVKFSVSCTVCESVCTYCTVEPLAAHLISVKGKMTPCKAVLYAASQLLNSEISSHSCIALLPSYARTYTQSTSQAHTYSHSSPLLCMLHCPTRLVSSHPMWKYWSGNRLLISCSNLCSTLHVSPYTNIT